MRCMRVVHNVHIVRFGDPNLVGLGASLFFGTTHLRDPLLWGMWIMMMGNHVPAGKFMTQQDLENFYDMRSRHWVSCCHCVRMVPKAWA